MKLRSQTFEYASQLLQFVEDERIKREDIQTITQSDSSFTLFYWTWNY